ncbi:MAG: hypothetical protein N3B14_07105 [Thermoleophilia bacterium]|nr:hypothetical protein [Thermoleophilia bacterium]
MATLRAEIELRQAEGHWVDVWVQVDFAARPEFVLTGARWLNEFAYISRSGVYPGSRIRWLLPETLFERGGTVELAFREGAARDLDLDAWSQGAWTWTALFKATTRDGSPYLEPIE